MSELDNIDHVQGIIEKVGVCMLTTQFARGLRADEVIESQQAVPIWQCCWSEI